LKSTFVYRAFPVMCGGNQELVTLTTHDTDTGSPETQSTPHSSYLVCHLRVQPHWSLATMMLDHWLSIWQYRIKAAIRNANHLDWWSSLTQNTGFCYHISPAVTNSSDCTVNLLQSMHARCDSC